MLSAEKRRTVGWETQGLGGVATPLDGGAEAAEDAGYFFRGFKETLKRNFVQIFDVQRDIKLRTNFGTR